MGNGRTGENDGENENDGSTSGGEEGEDDGSGYGSTIATTQTTEWSTSRTAVSTTERTTSTTPTTTSREVTTDSVSPSTTLVYTKDSTSTLSTSSEAGYLDLNNRASQNAIGAPVILASVLFSVFLLAVVFLCLIYKTRIKNVWKQKVKQQLQGKRGFNSHTVGESSQRVTHSVYNSAYSFIEHDVIVSSLPANMTERQNTISANDHYNVLNRENNTHNNLDPAKNPSNTSEYDLLNHSKRASSVENISGNLYHTADAVFSKSTHENTYDTASQSNVYSCANAGNFNSSANQSTDDYSVATQVANSSEVNQTNVYSSVNLNQETAHSCTEQRDDNCNTATQVTTHSRPDSTDNYHILDPTNIHFITD